MPSCEDTSEWLYRVSIRGLKTTACCPAISAIDTTLISSRDLPENIGPQMTRSEPFLGMGSPFPRTEAGGLDYIEALVRRAPPADPAPSRCGRPGPGRAAWPP